jgi:hypothetical protein
VQQRNQLRHDIRTDRIDSAEAQRGRKLVLTLLRDVLDGRGFFDDALCLLDDPCSHGRHRDFGAATLEKSDSQLIFQFLHRNRQRGLAHEAFFCCAPEVALARQGDDVAKLGEGHCSAIPAGLRFTLVVASATRLSTSLLVLESMRYG